MYVLTEGHLGKLTIPQGFPRLRKARNGRGGGVWSVANRMVSSPVCSFRGEAVSLCPTFGRVGRDGRYTLVVRRTTSEKIITYIPACHPWSMPISCPAQPWMHGENGRDDAHVRRTTSTRECRKGKHKTSVVFEGNWWARLAPWDGYVTP